MHPVVQKIRSILDEASIPYEYMEHAPGTSSEEMVAIRGYKHSLAAGAKALIVKTEKGFMQIVIPGDKKFSNAKLRKAIGIKSIMFAQSEELEKITNGVLPGAVPPFGNLFGLPVYVDTTVFKNDKIFFNCGERSASIAMLSEDYKKIVGPEILDLIKD